MKRYLILLASVLSTALASACDICGCGVGENYIGILPDFSAHIAGIRYRSNSIVTHIGAGGTSTYLTSREYYRTLEAWAGWNIGKRFRVMAAVPFSFNQRLNEGTKSSKSGPGDLSLTGYYQVLNSKKTVSRDRLLVQSLWVGGGLKAPTGKYNPDDKSASATNANLFQLGTGSLDFNLGAMYDIRLQDAGINAGLGYRLNTQNRYDYAYGNRFHFNAQGYYKLRLNKKLLLAPNAGLQFEKAALDTDNGFEVSVSGGRLWLGTLGVENSYGKMVVGANFQTPLSQNLANGMVKARQRLMLHLAVTF